MSAVSRAAVAWRVKHDDRWMLFETFSAALDFAQDHATPVEALYLPSDSLSVWHPSDLRCDQCDNGIADLRWNYCPWCGEVGTWDNPDVPIPAPADKEIAHD